MKIHCGGLLFISDFDSGNLGRVELLSPCESLDAPSSNTSTSNTSSSSSNSSPSNKPIGSPSQKCSQNRKHSLAQQLSSENSENSHVGGASPSKSPNKTCSSAPTIQGKTLAKDGVHTASRRTRSSRRLGSTDHVKVLEFKVWTKPDCADTPYENANRTWFYFGVQEGPPGATIRIHVMNLNRQGKLYNYGMAPVYKVVPGKEMWERIPEKISTRNADDGNFILSFTHVLPADPTAILYFAFTYPFTYTECQQMLDDLDEKYCPGLQYSQDSVLPPDGIYYCRELLCHSLDGHKVELLTLSSYDGISSEREPRLPLLFPDSTKPRCHKFQNKRVVFISSRVHPGETPASFVFNGFLHFLLSTTDSRASILRQLFVFKLVPLLNPDGVFHGYYRTDTLGINLNRVYLVANPEEHPSIYAVRTLLLFYHSYYASVMCESTWDFNLSHIISSQKAQESWNTSPSANKPTTDEILVNRTTNNSPTPNISQNVAPSDGEKCDLKNCICSEEDHHVHPVIQDQCSPGLNRRVSFKGGELNAVNETSLPVTSISSSEEDPSSDNANLRRTEHSSRFESLYTTSASNNISEEKQPDLQLTCKEVPDISVVSDGCVSQQEQGYTVALDEEVPFINYHSCEDRSYSPSEQLVVPSHRDGSKPSSEVEASDADEEVSISVPIEAAAMSLFNKRTIIEDELKVPYLPPEQSGIAFYIDLHGHASKRGCFFYGNYFVEPEKKVQSMLLAKLMTLNSPHFDFSACNFSVQNMYHGGSREGQSKEGSGRVALYTLTGIINSYTLECNYNTGRTVNAIPRLCGTVSPPWPGKTIPFYTPEIYQQVGRALAVSILDTTDQNPHSRLPVSCYHSLEGIKDWLKRHMCVIKVRSPVHQRDRHLSWATGINSVAKSQPSSAQNVEQANPRKNTEHQPFSSSQASPKSDKGNTEVKTPKKTLPPVTSTAVTATKTRKGTTSSSTKSPSLLKRQFSQEQNNKEMCRIAATISLSVNKPVIHVIAVNSIPKTSLKERVPWNKSKGTLKPSSSGPVWPKESHHPNKQRTKGKVRTSTSASEAKITGNISHTVVSKQELGVQSLRLPRRRNTTTNLTSEGFSGTQKTSRHLTSSVQVLKAVKEIYSKARRRHVPASQRKIDHQNSRHAFRSKQSSTAKSTLSVPDSSTSGTSALPSPKPSPLATPTRVRTRKRSTQSCLPIACVCKSKTRVKS